MSNLLCAECGRPILAHHGWMLSRQDSRDSAQILFVHRACAKHYQRRHRQAWIAAHIPNVQEVQG